MENEPTVFVRLMSESLLDVDPSILDHLKVGTEWNEIQVLTDPFVVYRNKKYLPAVLIEDIGTTQKRLLFVAALSLAEFLEPVRKKRGSLIGLNIKIRKTSEEHISPYEVEELAE